MHRLDRLSHPKELKRGLTAPCLPLSSGTPWSVLGNSTFSPSVSVISKTGKGFLENLSERTVGKKGEQKKQQTNRNLNDDPGSSCGSITSAAPKSHSSKQTNAGMQIESGRFNAFKLLLRTFLCRSSPTYFLLFREQLATATHLFDKSL